MHLVGKRQRATRANDALSPRECARKVQLIRTAAGGLFRFLFPSISFSVVIRAKLFGERRRR